MEYTKEWLNETIFVYQSESCRFGEDALALSAFTPVNTKDCICDLGTGTGIIPFSILTNCDVKNVILIEREPEICKMVQKTIDENHLSDKIKLLCEDWNTLSIKAESMDVVTCNPPYFKEGSGKVSENALRSGARHAAEDSPNDICKAASKLLKNGGLFCVCYKPERLTDLLTCLRKNGLEPKCIKLLTKPNSKKPWLCLCRAKKQAKPGLEITIDEG